MVLDPRVRPSDIPTRQPVAGNGSTVAGRPDSIFVLKGASSDTYLGIAGGSVKLAGTGPVSNPILTGPGHKPDPEEVRVIMNVFFAAADLLLPHFDEFSSEGGKPMTSPRC